MDGLRIELEDVCDLGTNYDYPAELFLALSEMRSIQLVHDKEESIKCGEGPDYYCPFSSAQFRQVQQQLRSLVYIVQYDYDYHRALADIQKQSVVSLYIEPNIFGYACRISIIVVATATSVYIFDISALGNIFTEFKVLLEAERPLKVVHNSKQTRKQLEYYQQVKVQGIFDTYVAYSRKNGTPENTTDRTMSLSELASKTFKLPKMYFNFVRTTDPSDPYYHATVHYDVYRRPFSRNYQEYTAKQAIFQLKLYEWMLHNYSKRSDSWN